MLTVSLAFAQYRGKHPAGRACETPYFLLSNSHFAHTTNAVNNQNPLELFSFGKCKF